MAYDEDDGYGEQPLDDQGGYYPQDGYGADGYYDDRDRGSMEKRSY